MKKLQTVDDFKMLCGRLRNTEATGKPTLVISAGTCGQASGANDLIRIAKREILAQDLSDKVHLRITGCHGFCQLEPCVLVEPEGTLYPNVDIDDMPRIMEAIVKGEVIEELLPVHPVSGKPIHKEEDLPFFKNQARALLASNKKVDPIRIYDYLINDGYSSFVSVLEKKDPGAVIDVVKSAGIRGRGGAGFPTGKKWEFLSKQPGERGKYLVCNADEGDPGAYMDRSLLEGNPHSIIEGMLIAALGTGATEGIVYVRAEYPLAIKHLLIALRQAHDLGILGENILDSGFSFDISVVRGAGAFVCGEETALIRSIEGKVGEPRQRPPFPIQKGVYGKPTAINNVETWANIPLIFRMGADEFAKIGTKGSTGTKIFSLVGKVKNTGLVEVPMGMTINEIVFDIGGGPAGEAPIKAVQTGGPSGGCIPVKDFSLPIDYDSLAKAGSIMGSGGMIVMDESTCMVDVAKYYMNFLKDESCGKCFPCRKGTQRMYEILDDISKGQASLKDLDLLEELALAVKDSTMCGLGQTASNPVLSTLKYFKEEYKRHIIDKKCDALVCKDLTGAPCQATCPLGTEAWRYVAHIRRGEFEEAYKVIREPNPFPSVCARVCNHPCETKCRAGESGGQPIAIRALKRFVTDNVDPSVYKPTGKGKAKKDAPKVAVVGAGPSGLTAAHRLSLSGCKVTVFEADGEPGGMLIAGIPTYRLPREVLKKEIDALIDENITLECNKALGRDFTVDGLLGDGYKAVYLALGAHKSRRLEIDNEDAKGVYPSIEFLKAFNLRGENSAKGHVGIIGGGNSAIDAARVAVRQKGVKSVTVLYRRTRQEMPAFSEEIDAAVEEGVKLETLVTPTKILTEKGRLKGIEALKNELGEFDASGRRRPIPIKGSEHKVELDTLIVAISESSDLSGLWEKDEFRLDTVNEDRLAVNGKTLVTNRPGVFAGGDVITGPNTVVDAIAAGKRAAVMINRYLEGKKLVSQAKPRIPKVYIEPEAMDESSDSEETRAVQPHIPLKERKSGFAEVELCFSKEDAMREAGRCLRCDLEFTKPKEDETEQTTRKAN